MFFSSECWQISPGLFCFSFALSAFHYYNFFYILFQRTVWNSGKSITYCCDTGLLALWNRKMHFPRVTFCLKFKLLEFQEGVGAWVGYTSMYKHKHCQPQDVSTFLHSSHSHLSAPASARFFLWFFNVSLSFAPSPIYWFLSFKCSLLSFLLFS